MADVAFLLERLRKIREDLRYQHCDIDFHIALDVWLKDAAKVLAAAEVERPSVLGLEIERLQTECDVLGRERDQMQAATIEACAKKLEELGARYHQGHDLPAAIRAMKEET